MFKELDLTPTNQTVGLGQKVYATQYGYVYIVNCAKCNQIVGTQSMWHDKDNSMRHLECLSQARIIELEMMSQL